ncbi:MAG: inositol-1-monophosphatase [gamma proteobacterium symbiont of Bathyaustriella thionipta]|nr:inositol-1-monophosphatase [gamma proteobacterium symbiont of Bathyaustriella thionipta]MCU7950023.1 inositol-1-monophosphatase [gamma proteobacterium symbiont of Bathyaustriella thionipta]MCU7952872.1 inositol-1-monophosphatase [gamma proteobacterium symbiont of Bathyaustriella thionipta]MCU7956611.1 inositol-1-monophosphatase [gamma proteobacterium symbiont of Bathyaustriella thionipta]MCU7968998.1 inositol-1-monophosphatase [gamma proteobacterium symbiont of Bathyaustriella thionipta]
MHPMLTIAVRAARAAGTVIYRSMDKVDNLKITTKAANDFVSDVDRQAEMAIIDIIKKAYPDHAIKAEENGELQGNSDFQWIIDPLDGTTNFLHGFPQFAVSIAFKQNGRLSQAVVFNPVNQELFTASRGEGAMLNDRRIRVSKQKGLEGALLGTGFPFKSQQHLDVYMETFKALFPTTAGIRRPGSAALDLAYVAAGRMDGFWEIALNDWDMAAGALLVKEAGGLVGDFSGGDDFLETGNVIAGSPKVFKEILQTIKPHLSSDLAR